MDANPDYYTQPSYRSLSMEKNKIFQDKNKFKQYVATNLALQKVIEGKLQPKEYNIPNTAYNNSDI